MDWQRLRWKAEVRMKDGAPFRKLEPGSYLLIGRAGPYRSAQVPIRVVEE
jgi:hypothetical protein